MIRWKRPADASLLPASAVCRTHRKKGEVKFRTDCLNDSNLLQLFRRTNLKFGIVSCLEGVKKQF